MADRYWVGGTGTWSSTNTANWSASSGGATGASVPTATDNVFFDANSNVGTGAFTVTMANSPRVCNDFTASGLDGTMTLAGTSIGLTVSGSLTFQATNFTRTYTGTTTFNATTTGKTITTNGVGFGNAVTFNGVGGAWSLGSALQLTGGSLTLTNGTLNLDGKTLTTGFRFATATGTKNLTFNGGTLVCALAGANSFTNPAPTGFTTTAGTGVGIISMTSASAKTFNGNGSTFNCTLNQAGVGTLTVTGNNTFSNITNTVNLTSVLFTGGTTNIFTNFNLTGILANLVTLGSTDTTQATLQKGSTWFMGANSTDSGNNTGLTFTAGGGIDYLNVSYINGTVVAPASSVGGNFLMFF